MASDRSADAWLPTLAAFLAVYLLAVAGLAYQYVSLSLHVNDLRKWQSEHAQALDLVHEGRAAWKELAPVVDTQDYPLELLREASQSIPSDQLHLTDFEAGGGHLLIKGETKNVEGAYTFYNKLKGDPYFSSYSLNMVNPGPLPNDLWQFQIEGSHASN